MIHPIRAITRFPLASPGIVHRVIVRSASSSVSPFPQKTSKNIGQNNSQSARPRKLSSLHLHEEYEQSKSETSSSQHESPSFLSYVSGVEMPITSTLHITTPGEDVPSGTWPVFRIMVRWIQNVDTLYMHIVALCLRNVPSIRMKTVKFVMGKTTATTLARNWRQMVLTILCYQTYHRQVKLNLPVTKTLIHSGIL